MHHDRRKRRAHSPLLAIEHYMDSARQSCNAAQVMLFDRSELIASSDCPEPVRLQHAALVRDAMAGRPTGRDVYLHPITLNGRQLLLGSIDRRVRSVRAAESAILRIFAG